MTSTDTPPKPGRRARQFWHEVATLGRLARAVAAGEYTMAAPKVALLLATLGYVVDPLDAIPDPTPIVGLLDDMGVVATTAGLLVYEVACFRDWELNRGSW